jgi:hypothetical protein
VEPDEICPGTAAQLTARCSTCSCILGAFHLEEHSVDAHLSRKRVSLLVQRSYWRSVNVLVSALVHWGLVMLGTASAWQGQLSTAASTTSGQVAAMFLLLHSFTLDTAGSCHILHLWSLGGAESPVDAAAGCACGTCCLKPTERFSAPRVKLGKAFRTPHERSLTSSICVFLAGSLCMKHCA